MLAQNEISTWRTEAGDLDVLTNIPAHDGRRLGYEDLAHRANIVQGNGFVVRAANLADIVAPRRDFAGFEQRRKRRTCPRLPD